MRIVNRYKLTRFPDYILLQLGWGADENATDLGTEPVELVIPLTTCSQMGMDIFKAMWISGVYLTQFFTQLQATVNELNKLGPQEIPKKEIILAGVGEAGGATGTAWGSPITPVSQPLSGPTGPTDLSSK